MSPLLDPRTRSKVSISSKDRTELLAFIDPANVPLEYGGTDPTPIGQAPEELDMVAYTVCIYAWKKKKKISLVAW